MSAPVIAPQSVGEIRVMREGSQRWLSTPQTPEQIWPQLEAFWRDRSIKLITNDAAAGVMEYDIFDAAVATDNDADHRVVLRAVAG